MSAKPPVVLPFVLAVLLAAVLASLVQSHFTVTALVALGAPMPLEVRLDTMARDLLGFAPTFALLCSVAFLVALPLTGRLLGRHPVVRLIGFASSGALAIWCALTAANFVLPMPTLIAADRYVSGTLGLLLAGACGAVLFSWLSRSRG